MSPKGKKAVVREFERLLDESELDFVRCGAGLPRRATYTSTVSDDFTTCLFIHWHSYLEQFCFEVGWLFRSTFDDICSCFDTINALKRDAVILPMNIVAGQSAERWWVLQPSGFDVQVALAFDELSKVGLPFLDEVAKEKGL